MDIFFSILDHYSTENEARKKPEPVHNEVSTRGFSLVPKLILILAGIALIYTLVTKEYSFIFPIGIVVFFTVIVPLLKENHEKEITSPSYFFMQQKWLVLNEEIHFLDNEIQVHVLQDKYILKCAYKDIENLQLCYQDIRDVYHTKASFFTWNHRTGRYKYYFSLQDGDSKKKLLTLLDFLYKNNIPIQETDDDENELYMLQIRPKKMKVAEEIQDLIDEIGKDDTKA